MPIYEYTCKSCGAAFEAMSPMSSRDEMDCESCGSSNTERLASTFCCSVDEGSSMGSASPGGFSCGSGG